jgi:ribosomal protein S6
MSKLNCYEGLFILNTAGKDDSVPDILAHIESEIKNIGGKVANVQKMDRRPFARASHKQTSGYFANIIFHGPPDSVKRLNSKFALDETVFRVLFLRKDEPKAADESKPKKGKAKSRG